MRPNGHFDVEAVKRHVDIERLLKKYDVQLKRTGADSLTGKCPFHQDKSPSLSVTPSKGLWHCFGCGAAGDGIALVQRKENLDFPAALKRTAEFAGMSSLPAVETATPQGATAKPKVNGQATSGAKTQSSRIVETYPYTDEKGELLYEVLRLEPKSFRQRRPDGNGGWTWSLGDVRRVLYRLPAVLKSEKSFRCRGREGRSHTRGLRSRRDDQQQRGKPAVASCIHGGTDRQDRNRHPRLDSDEPGRERGNRIVKELTGKAEGVLLVELPTGRRTSPSSSRRDPELTT